MPKRLFKLAVKIQLQIKNAIQHLIVLIESLLISNVKHTLKNIAKAHVFAVKIGG